MTIKELQKDFPFKTPQAAQACKLDGARIRQLAPMLEKMGLAVKVNHWQFSAVAIEKLKHRHTELLPFLS